MSVPDGEATAAGEPIPIERLMAELVDRAEEIISAQRRLRRLIAASRAVLS